MFVLLAFYIQNGSASDGWMRHVDADPYELANMGAPVNLLTRLRPYDTVFVTPPRRGSCDYGSPIQCMRCSQPPTKPLLEKHSGKGLLIGSTIDEVTIRKHKV